MSAGRVQAAELPTRAAPLAPGRGLRQSWIVVRPAQVAAGVVSAALGFTVIVAWVTRSEALTRVHPLFSPMPYSVALGLLVCGVALLAGAAERRRLAAATALVVFSLGLAALAQQVLGLHWNLNHALLGGLVDGTPAGMATSSALSFVLVGVGLGAVSVHPSRGSFACAIAGTTVASQSAVAFIGYGFGVTRSQFVTGDAPHVAVGLAVVGIGTIAAAWTRGPESSGAPRWVPLPVALGIALVSISLWHQSESDHRAIVEEGTRLRAERIGVDLNRRAVPMTAALARLAREEAARIAGLARIEPQVLAALDLERFPSLSAIALVDSAFEFRWIQARSSATALFPDLREDDRARHLLYEDAVRRSPTILDSVRLRTGQMGFVITAPVRSEERVAGFVVGLFRYEDFFSDTIGEEAGADYGLRVFRGPYELYRHGGRAAPGEAFTAAAAIPFLGADWRAQIWPRSVRSPRRSLADGTLLFGFLFAGLVGWTVQLGQRSAQRRNELTHVSADLESAIAARQAAQAAQVESEARFRQIIDAAADVVYRTDATGRFTFVNPAAIRVTKWARDELIGRDYLSLIRPDHQSAVRAFYEKQAREGIPSTYLDFPVLTADGEEVWIGQHVQLLKVGETLVGFQAVARDISERIRVQHELQRMKDAALETARLKSEFVANTSHEIRTPLNGIVGFSSLLLDTHLDDQQRTYADGLRVSAEALLGIVNDILDFSKIEAGMLRLETLSFELRATIHHSVMVFAEVARRKQIALDVHLDDGLPRRVKGDPSRLRQVLTNLLSNAIKFTERGSITVRVKTEAETESHAVIKFSVRDTGIGIAAEAQRHLFQPFVQEDGSTNRRYGGTGLGLAISRQIAELMGGTIDLESAPGLGSTFSFTARIEKDSGESSIGGQQPVVLAGTRVLIVSDSVPCRQEFARHLDEWGMTVGEAHNGADALAMLQQAVAEGRPYRVALLSLQHPQEDAIALARSIKADTDMAAVTLVLIPPKGVLGDARKASESGVVAYLPRPVTSDELRRCLHSVLSGPPASSNTPGQTSLPLVTRHALLERPEARNYCILVTDDNPVSQQVTRLLIEKLGYAVETANNGAEAVQAAMRRRHALILMDCQMPVMDGYTATTEIRRVEGADRHTPIVAFTASAGPRGRERCLQAGMDDYLEKPIRGNELIDVLDRWIHHSAAPLMKQDVGVRLETAELIDTGVLHTLGEQVGLEAVRQTIELHLNQADASLRGMEHALAQDRVADLIKEAHRLKGGSLTLGFARLGTLCARLEELADTSSPSERQQMVQRLREACADLRVWQRGSLWQSSSVHPSEALVFKPGGSGV